MMNHNTLYLREMSISDSIAVALKEFLSDTAEEPHCWVKSLVIDGCSMSEKAFANIIDGIIAQGLHLTALSYSNSTFAESNFHQL